MLDQEITLLSQLARHDASNEIWGLRFVAAFSVRAWTGYLFNLLVSTMAYDDHQAVPLLQDTAAVRRLYAPFLAPSVRVDPRAGALLTEHKRPVRRRPTDYSLTETKGLITACFELDKGAYATSLLRSSFYLLSPASMHL
jgi:hypothetical protein